VQKILITGSEGFIGKALARSLNAAGYDVITVDNSGSSKSTYKSDIKDEKMLEIFSKEKPDVVIHLAAQIDVMQSFKDPIGDLGINGIGTLNILQAAIALKVSHFIYINSGGAIYDPFSKLPIVESAGIRPLSPYGISKFIGESYVRILCEENGIGWTSLGLSNCYGPISENKKGVIYKFVEGLSRQEAPVIYGENMTRDFIYIDDVVDAITKTLNSPANCRVNISSGIETNIVQLFFKIRELLGSKLEPIIAEARFGEIQRNSLSNSLALKVIGWSPTTSLDEGLIKSLELE
jgi:UDP-glucose 4-epimerase